MITLNQACRQIIAAKQSAADAASEASERGYQPDDLWLAAITRRAQRDIYRALKGVGCASLDELAREIADSGGHFAAAINDSYDADGFDFQIGRDLLDDCSRFTATGQEAA